MKKGTLILLLLILVKLGNAQVPFFQSYTLLKKNEPVNVNALFQDKTGYMWFGTNKGLFKFDGKDYTRFTTADSLPDNNVTAIAEDSLGRIWLGHKNGTLSFIEKGKVVIFNPEEGTSSVPVSDILFDKKGNMWFSTLDDGLYYFIHERLYRLDTDNGMPDLFIYDLMEDAAGTIWAGTDGGIALCTMTDKNVQIKVLNYKTGLPDNIIKKIHSASDSKVWLATEDAGLISYDIKSRLYKPLSKQKWSHGTITDFIEKNNKLWISTSKGLVVYENDLDTLKVYGNAKDVSLLAITVLAKDNEGNIWGGSKTNVIRTTGDEVELIENFEPLLNKDILALCIDHTSAIWFTTSEGLYKRTINNEGRAIVEKKLLHTTYQNFKVISLYVDDTGFVWAGLYGEGVLRINPLTDKITYLNKELRNGNVLNITGKGKSIWLATLGGGTEIKIDGDNISVKNYSRNEGLISDYIYQVFIDSKDRVWFATDRAGVDMLDASGFHHYKKELSSKVIYGFAEDGDHNIWASTQSDGLYKLEGEAFKPFHKKMRDTNISCLSADKSGNIVLMNDLGIDVYDIQTDRIYSLDDAVGIHDNKANLNALAKDIDGNIFFGTVNGIIKYSGVTLKKPSGPLPLIDGLKVMNKSVSFNEGVSFKYNQNIITISFIGLWYQSPLSLYYRYKLFNYDMDWIYTGDRSTTYSNLPPGNYNFLVETSQTDDFKYAKQAKFKFTIRTPFWKTNVFYGLSILLVVALTYSIIKYRERKLRQDKELLAQKVEERTVEIWKKNEEIQAQAEEIKGINENLEMLVQERTIELERKNKALEDYAFINAHELRAPVASILGLINLISKTTLSDEATVIVDHMENSAEKLNTVVRSITTAIEKGV